MNKYKFRVWKIGYPSYLKDRFEGISFFYANEWRDIGYFLNKDDFIVEQFTGLQDKDGKDIFEGDIVNGKYIKYHERDDSNYTVNYESEVKFIRSAFCINYNFCWHELPFYFDKEDEEFIKIIGNIHENPELLKL